MIPRLRRSDRKKLAGDFAGIRDRATAVAWLATLDPLGEEKKVAQMRGLLIEIMISEFSAEARFDMVEPVRTVVAAKLCEYINEHTMRSIPMALLEADPIWRMTEIAGTLCDIFFQLMNQLGSNYAADREAAENAESERVAHLFPATSIGALQRMLDLHASILVLYQQLKVAIPEQSWDRHCRMGQLVRELDCQDIQIGGRDAVGLTSTCRQGFVAPILVALADPTTLSITEFQAVLAAGLRWSEKVGFRIDPVNETANAPARPVINPGPSLSVAGHRLRFDTQRVHTSIDRRLAALDQGVPVTSLGLGDAISASVLRGLLQGLQRRWGPVLVPSIDFPDHVWRVPEADIALCHIGFPAQSGRQIAAVQPTRPTGVAYETHYNKMRNDSVMLQQRAEELSVDMMLDGAEQWNIIGETADTFLCLRRHSRPRANLSQLVGIKLGGQSGTTPYLLGNIYALQQGIGENDAGITRPVAAHLLRVRLIPGFPQPARALVDEAEYDRVYLVAPQLQQDAGQPLWDRVAARPGEFSIVVPLATYRPERIVRIVANSIIAEVRCEGLINRGLDYDHIAISLVAATAG